MFLKQNLNIFLSYKKKIDIFLSECLTAEYFSEGPW
jgi:hypothetical protein